MIELGSVQSCYFFLPAKLLVSGPKSTLVLCHVVTNQLFSLKYTLAFYQDLKKIFDFILLLQLSAPYSWAVRPVSMQQVMIMPAYL